MNTENHTDTESVQAGPVFGDSAREVLRGTAFRHANDRDAVLVGLRLAQKAVATDDLGSSEKLALASLSNAGELDGLTPTDIGSLSKDIAFAGAAQ
jgi:hypothetical protein